MTVKLADLRSDSWASITSVIERGEHPERADIAAALSRGEMVPAAAQVYLAKLVNGEIDKRGRPRQSKIDEAVRASELLDAVEELGFDAVKRARRNEKGALTKALARAKIVAGGDRYIRPITRNALRQLGVVRPAADKK